MRAPHDATRRNSPATYQLIGCGAASRNNELESPTRARVGYWRATRLPRGVSSDSLSTAFTNSRTFLPSGESAFVDMNGEPLFRALIARRYSFRIW